MYFTNLFFNHIQKMVTSVSTGNQWVLWLSWTEPICHKRGMLFADTKSFIYDKKKEFICRRSVLSEIITWFISEEKQPLTSVLNLAHWALAFFGKVKRWAVPVLGGGSMAHVLYYELNLGCTKRDQVLSSLLLVCCYFSFSGISIEANSRTAHRRNIKAI